VQFQAINVVYKHSFASLQKLGELVWMIRNAKSVGSSLICM